MPRPGFRRLSPAGRCCVWLRRGAASKPRSAPELCRAPAGPCPARGTSVTQRWFPKAAVAFLQALHAALDTLSADTVIRAFAWAWCFFGGLKGEMPLCTVHSAKVRFSWSCFIIKTREREGSNASIFFWCVSKTIIKGAYFTCNYLQLEFRSGRCLNPWWKLPVSTADALSGHSLLGSMGLCWGGRCQALWLPLQSEQKISAAGSTDLNVLLQSDISINCPSMESLPHLC